ncbi:uncharacterized protein TA16650 [Theileria annulata]|uniref:RAP domain-containing protein n=1 Tax=Theileria annulata TaxID=5874 RepID=Q4UJ02_THEAN|nr:uncharacterized protein TA16650 [Theileria annulata]CAI72937.1 hypothetical protein, conserved [Theileria annulata]|eukprot:XP_953615.1 hypothetical protein, conserved [Theileria annulata]
MAYGVGTVFLPMIRRFLVVTIALEIGYITYDCVIKPTAKSVNRALFPSVPKKPKSHILCQTNHYSSFTQSNTNISNIITQFNNFKPLLNHYPITPKHTQMIREEKKSIKESMNGLINHLEELDLESLYQILTNCHNISHKLVHTPFNQKLIKAISSQILNQEPKENTVSQSLNERELLFKLFISISTLNKQNGLHEELRVNFDGLYHLLNKHLSYYIIEQLIELLISLGNIYVKTNLEGIKSLNQKIVYLLCDKIDKSNTKPSLYTFIQIIKSISKSNLNHLIKLISPFINPNNLVDVGNNDDMRLEYKLTKLNVHLLTILLQTNYIDFPLFNSIIGRVNSFLLRYYKDTSINPLSTEITINQYNVENKFVNNLLYPQCTNKLFRIPQEQTSKSDHRMESLDYILISSVNKLMINGKLAFVRGLKLCEMYFTTLYPQEYSQLTSDLSYLKLLNYTNDKEYLITSNLLEKNRKLIESQLGAPKNLIVVRVGIYYIIALDPERKLYIEMVPKDDKLTIQLAFRRKYLHSNGWNPISIQQ